MPAEPILAFRALTRADLPLLRRWLNTEHVHAWWGRQSGPGSLGGVGADAATTEQVEAKYGPTIDQGGATHRYVILADHVPVGLIQWYRLSDYPDYARDIGENPIGAAGLDLLIGEPSALGRGLGPRALAVFVTDVVFRAEGMTRAVGGPAVTNRRSIRAFEKAGFRHVRDAAVPGEAAHEAIMVKGT